MGKMTKKLALLLGIILLMSGTAYGTWAYFKDTKEENIGIKLTLGNVKVTTSSEEWINESASNTQAEKLSSDKTNTIYTNVSPGDKFTKTFIFSNKGSLTSNLVFNTGTNKLFQKGNNDNGYTSQQGAYLISIKPINETAEKFNPEGTELATGEKIELKMTINVAQNLNNKKYNKDDVLSDGVILSLLNDSIKVNAEQINK